MKKLMILIFFVAPFLINAQNLVLPKEAKDKLKGIHPSKDQVSDTVTSNQLVSKDLLNNFRKIRVEYALEYENGNEIVSLGKDGNDYFGYHVIYGVVGDNMLWVNKLQLLPWVYDEAYKLYAADSLKPVVTNILVSKIGSDDFDEVEIVDSNVEVQDDDLKAYALPENNHGFSILKNSKKGSYWLLMLQDAQDESSNNPNESIISIASTDRSDVESIIETYKSAGKSFSSGVIFNSKSDYKDANMDFIVVVDNEDVIINSPLYKKSLTVIKTTEKTDAVPAKLCCCEDMETIKDKSKRKKIIKRWQSELKVAKKQLKKMESGNEKDKLQSQINDCSSQIKYYK